MKILSASAAVFIISITAFNSTSLVKYNNTTVAPVSTMPKDPKIQVAILLDVSGSMSGLIEQAKAQLWNMVSVMGRAKCENGIPKIEIALYEYGRPANDVKTGYIRQINSFTSDLDKLSLELFKLRTDGGDEYCGQVIHTSLDELSWDASSSNYKVIFIAGNEDFLQGSIHYTQACDKAKKKGVIVNTIYCGPKEMGIREHWNLGGECGNGSFTYIDHNAKLDDIPTPYDSTLFLLNDRLNGTYIAFGEGGREFNATQVYVDANNYKMNKSSAARRVAVKANKQLYNNSGWDLVDATMNDTTGKVIEKLDVKTLPDSLKNKTRAEIQRLVNSKAAERSLIQKDIATLSTQRETFIAREKSKTTGIDNKATLETQVERIIKEQVKRFNMFIE